MNNEAVILAVLSLISTIITSITAYYVAKISRDTKEAAVTTEKIHVAVNSERSAMIQKVENLHAEILKVSKANAILKEAAVVSTTSS